MNSKKSMDNSQEYECEFCDNVGPRYTHINVIGGYFMCKDCEDKLDDKTGYCSIECQLGGGCDESC